VDTTKSLNFTLSSQIQDGQKTTLTTLLHPFAQLLEQRLGSRVTDAQSEVGRLATDLLLDGIESADPGQSFGFWETSLGPETPALNGP